MAPCAYKWLLAFRAGPAAAEVNKTPTGGLRHQDATDPDGAGVGPVSHVKL